MKLSTLFLLCADGWHGLSFRLLGRGCAHQQYEHVAWQNGGRGSAVLVEGPAPGLMLIVR